MFQNHIDFSESGRKLRANVRRFFEFGKKISYRKLFIIFFVFALIILYIAPNLLKWVFSNRSEILNPLDSCLDDRLTPFYLENREFNANIRSKPILPHEIDIIPYIGK